MTAERKKRILIASPGLDGHDRGAKVVAYALKDAGMEVIYLGIHRTSEEIVIAALDSNDRASHQIETFIHGISISFILLTEPLYIVGISLENLHCLIGGSPIDYHNFCVGIVLFQNTQ